MHVPFPQPSWPSGELSNPDSRTSLRIVRTNFFKTSNSTPTPTLVITILQETSLAISVCCEHLGCRGQHLPSGTRPAMVGGMHTQAARLWVLMEAGRQVSEECISHYLTFTFCYSLAYMHSHPI